MYKVKEEMSLSNRDIAGTFLFTNKTFISLLI